MKIQAFSQLVLFSALALLLSVDTTTARQQGSPPENLSFQADIYGNSNLETIEYLSDLNFYSYGGFGTNAHIYRARLAAGDEVAYAVSANDPFAFSLQVTTGNGDPANLVVTNEDYSSGTVTMPSPSELHFTWEINQSGLQINLHRHVTLESNSQVAAQYVVREVFSVENLGPSFTFISFSEYLHMDDATSAQDFDCDGSNETLLAINNFSSNGYPVFGKLHEQQANRRTEMLVNGNFTTVNTITNGVSGLEFGAGEIKEIAAANYVSSTAKNGTLAAQQITNDISTLLGNNQLADRWSLRSYNTDDRGAAFINGLMVVGSKYSTYPDSGWVNVCKHWNREGDNYVSLASWDLGVCCSATWGFGVMRDDQVLWSEEGSGPTNLGITYNKILRVTQSGVINDYEQPMPSTNIDGDWELTIRANGGFAFALIDKLPIAGSTNNILQTINITDWLGKQDNHIHLNVWNDGTGNHNWDFTIKRDGNIIWQNQMVVSGGARGRLHHIHLIIDENGNVYPLLDLPVDYQQRSNGSTSNFNSTFSTRLTSVFDHSFPFWGDGNTSIIPYTGRSYSNPGGSGDCSPSPLGCYDEHDAYDIDDRCPVQSPCLDQYVVYPSADGMINEDETGWINNALGCQITIDHGNDWKTIYTHLDGPGENQQCPGLLRNSGVVTQFEPIAKIGCSGSGCSDNATHLHFIVKHNDKVVDPSGWHQDPQILVDPWANHSNGTVSYPMWLYSNNTRQRIEPGLGGQLVLPTNQITMTIPPVFHTVPLTFSLSNIPVENTGIQVINIGHSFSITAIDDLGNFIDEMASNITVQVRFNTSQLQGIIKFSTLSLYTWNETTSGWQPVPTTLDFGNSLATAQIDYLSNFALLAEPTDKVYLPIVMQSD